MLFWHEHLFDFDEPRTNAWKGSSKWSTGMSRAMTGDRLLALSLGPLQVPLILYFATSPSHYLANRRESKRPYAPNFILSPSYSLFACSITTVADIYNSSAWGSHQHIAHQMEGFDLPPSTAPTGAESAPRKYTSLACLACRKRKARVCSDYSSSFVDFSSYR